MPTVCAQATNKHAWQCISMRACNALYSAFSELENDHEVWAGLRWSVHGGGAAEGGHSEADQGRGAGAPVDLGELVLGAGEADLESLGFAEPAFAVGFGDAGGQVVADLGDAVALGGVGPVQGASEAAGLLRVFRTAELMLFHAVSCRFRYSSWTSCGVL
jgi:hypothetical protein